MELFQVNWSFVMSLMELQLSISGATIYASDLRFLKYDLAHAVTAGTFQEQ